MAKAPKFMFERDFDEEEIAARAVAEEILEAVEEQEPEPEEVAPSFTEEDMAAAKEMAYADGRKQGTTEALNSVEAKTAETLTSVGEKLGNFVIEQQASQEELRNDAVQLCAALVRKLLPSLADQQAFEDVAAMTTEVVQGLLREARIMVRVNESLAAMLKERLSAHLTELGYEGVLKVTGDENVAMGDCTIEWSDGSAVRSMADLITELDRIVARNTGHAAQPGPAVESASEAPAESEPPEAHDEHEGDDDGTHDQQA